MKRDIYIGKRNFFREPLFNLYLYLVRKDRKNIEYLREGYIDEYSDAMLVEHWIGEYTESHSCEQWDEFIIKIWGFRVHLVSD